MAQPVAYAPVTSFIGYQAQQPWFPGQNIDVELNALKTTTDQVRANLALIQRDDGGIANGSVGFLQLDAATQAVFLTGIASSLVSVPMTDGQLFVGQTGANPLAKTMSGDATLAKTGVLTLVPITYARLQTVAAVSLLGNPTGSLVTPQGITLGATLAFSGTALQTAALTGDVTASANSFATTIAANAVTNAKAAQMPAFTLKGNATSSTANATDISIPALTQKVTPVAGDMIMIVDSAASNALKFALVSSVSSAGSVTSIAGNTGAFTLGAGLKNSTNVILADPVYLRGYISGLTLSNDGGTPNTILDISAGVATDVSQASLMSLASNYTKTTGSWGVGTATGALDTGAVAASTWYHVFIIQRSDTGIVDLLFSTSASAPTMPTNYDRKRRIGSFKTDGSSHIIAFQQNGNIFYWAAPVIDFNSTIGTSRSLLTLSAPLGVVTTVIFYGAQGSAGNANVWIGPPSVTDAAPSLTVSPGSLAFQTVAGASQSFGYVQTATNTSSQVAARSDTASTTVRIHTQGWIDQL